MLHIYRASKEAYSNVVYLYAYKHIHRIMELARKACEESKYRITNVFSGYLKVAVKNLSHIIDEPEETGKVMC